jgi:hypothetical protein
MLRVFCAMRCLTVLSHRRKLPAPNTTQTLLGHPYSAFELARTPVNHAEN